MLTLPVLLALLAPPRPQGRRRRQGRLHQVRTPRAWLASYPGDSFARWLVAAQSPMRLESSVFAYPWWLVAGVPLGVTVLTVLAAAYPARRAARIDPIEALRER